MAQFTVNQGAFTPSTAQDNWTLNAQTAGGVAFVKMFSWGGRSPSTGGNYRTRWTRPSTNGSSTFTTLNPENTNPLVTPVNQCGTFATAPVLPTDPQNLFAQDWNFQGGGGVIVLPIGGEWMVVNSATAGHQQISCRNVSGTDANLSSYSVQWAE